MEKEGMQEEKRLVTDVVIIGAGPVGLFAVFELGLLDMKAIVVDTLERPGGQCAELYPQKPIYDIPGIPHATGQELTENLLMQIKPFHPQFLFGETVLSIKEVEPIAPQTTRFLVTTKDGTTIEACIVVAACGGGNFEPKRPSLSNLGCFETSGGVLYSVKNKSLLEGKDLVIAGGGDAALDWTLALAKESNVTLVHRRREFRGTQHAVNQLQAFIEEGRVRFIAGEVRELLGEGNVLRAVMVEMGSGEKEKISCAHFLPFFGLTMKMGPIATWGLVMQDHLIEVNTKDFSTSREGIFAIGDINTYPGKLKLILSGFHEAALMAQKAFAYVFPGERNVFRYTTASTSLHKKLGV